MHKSPGTLEWLVSGGMYESAQWINGLPGFEQAWKLSRMESGLHGSGTQILAIQFSDFLRDTPIRPPEKLTKLYAARQSQSFEFHIALSFISSLQRGYHIIYLRINRLKKYNFLSICLR
jgi:hypothetical protein